MHRCRNTAACRSMSAMALCIAALCPAFTVHATDPRPLGALVGACQACHGALGVSASGAIPNLAGQQADYLARQLEAFRSGERKNDLMAAMARQLGDAEIRTLAQFWSQLTPMPGASVATANVATPSVATPSVATASVATPSAIRPRMSFPKDFPNGFTLYDSPAAEGGRDVARRFANAAALSAAKAGRPLPAGSMIVVSNHATPADPARSYSAMEVRAGSGASLPELLRNGDWDYALFGADRIRRDTANIAACLACHKPLAADSHLFTLKALRAAGAADAGLGTDASAPR